MEYWLAPEEELKRIQEMADKYERLNQVALVSDEIAIVFREKASKSGGKVSLGKTLKTSPMQTALSAKDWKFVLQVGHDEWVKLDATQREALLFHLLCGCGVKEDEEAGGDLAFTVIPPDIQAYREELEIFGVWQPKGEDEEEASSASVEALFSKKELDKGKGVDAAEEEDSE